jgi:hypothetical protein
MKMAQLKIISKLYSIKYNIKQIKKIPSDSIY